MKPPTLFGSRESLHLYQGFCKTLYTQRESNPHAFSSLGLTNAHSIDYALVKSHMSTNSIMGAYCGEHVQGNLERQPALLFSLSIIIPVLLCLHHKTWEERKCTAIRGRMVVPQYIYTIPR